MPEIDGIELTYRLKNYPDTCNIPVNKGYISRSKAYHHERYDGKGYPDNLAGENIPLIARIIAIADVYDAMTSNRAYRKGMTPEEACKELKCNKGQQHDPELINIIFKAQGI